MKKTPLILALSLGLTVGTSAYAAKYQAVEVSGGGSVSGKVTFTGDDPGPKIFAITKDQEVCGKGNREIDYVKVSNGGLSNVVVYLDKVKKGKAFDAAQETGKVDQKGCAFEPFIQVMHNDKGFTAVNSDPVSHNIHTYEMMGRAKKTLFNVSQPDKDSSITKKVKLKRGVAMKIECDQHDFMHGFAFVAKSPYYALVAEDGSYTIDNVPAGKYKIKAWHGTLKDQKGSVEVAAGANSEVNFEFKGK
ncbi:carboxypeptidase-like regulatory domain-containing protein [Candidatus Venteria ishoeyi]|uniref:Rhamnogalacturonan lyase domain-containing protein n=1 Tax=Candidatus Venteria ishoeyi TaxID=1899563 RepID=A0A1H6FB14_9GAMM|nr:carboxypeptidase-like regulatory domain-containing protein [Candidatus Venteria ishoeyi]MDM8545388.1 carboxypeptidase-like regulatory domain-containing protein [Candidatus Venteria ishoeyi]SEH07277.1 Uncharacterised protein [Candidatus Venteria ishoeyi]